MQQWRHRTSCLGYGLFLLVLLAAGPFVQAQDAAWTGSMQCQLTVQTPNYTHQELQTWTITGPPKDTGSLSIYPASWSVTAQGGRQDVQGTQSTSIQWSANVPPMAAPLVIFARASDKQLIIKSYHGQLRANAAGPLTTQAAVAGLRQPSSQQTFAVYEWQFPLVQDSVTSTSVSGTSSTDISGGIGPMQPAGLPGTAVCKWSFRKGAAATTSPQLTERLSKLSSALQPTAKSWVAQQAQTIKQQPQPDAAQIEAQVREHFVSSNGGLSELPPGTDITEMAELVMMEAAKDQDADIKQLLEEANKQNTVKKALDEMIKQVNRDALSGGTKPTEICTTPSCQSLSAEMKKLAGSMPQISQSAQMVATTGPSYQQLQQILAQLQNAKDSTDDLSSQTQTRMQAYMDRRSKMEQELSNMLKKSSDTASQVISNMK